MICAIMPIYKRASMMGPLMFIFIGLVSVAPQLNVQASSIDERYSRQQATLTVIESPEQAVRVLENLIKNILYSANLEEVGPLRSQKRGLDFGINRGFSGSQAGKHLMGLSAASFAGGPGK